MLGDVDSPRRRGLALAGGGIVGGLWEIGALLALDAMFEDFGTGDFDFYVGSSAGAFISALLANRVRPAHLLDALEADHRSLPHLSGAQFLTLPWRAYLATGPRLAAALPRLVRDVWSQWDDVVLLDTLTALLRVFPRGLFTAAGIEGYVRRALTRGGRTNDFRRLRRRLLIPATALDTGTIRVFGSRINERTPISQAVAASAAIPFFFAPFRIDGVDYVDAMVTKTAHAGLAGDRGAQLVVVVNPLRPIVVDPATQPPLAEGGPLAIAGQALRIAVQRRLHDGLARYQFVHPGTDVVLLEPYQHDVRLFDTPLMTYARRREITRRGYKTTIKAILSQYDRYTLLFARHDMRLRSRAALQELARQWSDAPKPVAERDAPARSAAAR